MFHGQLISLREDVSWPSRSPDFFLWGYLKAQVFKHCPRTLKELKENSRTHDEIAGIPHDMLAKTF